MLTRGVDADELLSLSKSTRLLTPLRSKNSLKNAPMYCSVIADALPKSSSVGVPLSARENVTLNGLATTTFVVTVCMDLLVRLFAGRRAGLANATDFEADDLGLTFGLLLKILLAV
jgi:hypothetical protein